MTPFVLRQAQHERHSDREVEAKFSVAGPRVLDWAARLQVLGRFSRVGSGRERQINRYWDTDDLRLRRAKAVLKMRQVGRRAEMIFKRELRYRAGVSERIEITAPISLPKVRRLLDRGPFIEPVRCARKLIGRRVLEEVLCLRTDRRAIRFAVGGERLELALDQVAVLQAGRIVGSFQEVELENWSARERSFREAVWDLRRQLGPGARISRTPKYGVGLRLLQLKG